VNRFTPVARLSLGLVALTGTVLLGLDMAGFLPEPAEVALESRLALSEALAAQAAAAAATRDLATLRQSLQITVERHPEMLSAGLRDPGGRLLLRVGEHRRLWEPEAGRGSTASHIRIPLMRSGDPWADLELRFVEPGGSGAQAIWDRPVVPLLAAMSVLTFLAYVFYLRRSLRHLDPSAVIPARVQATLDVMAEGVVLLDGDERAVLVNAPFAERIGRTPESLLGVEISSLGWQRAQGPGSPASPAWTEALLEGRSCTGQVVRLDTPEGIRTFVVNASPVRDGWGKPKGVIATFDDVTELQSKTEALERAMAELEKTQDEIRLQNEELEVLAKRDSLTGVTNRRAFMELLEKLFAEARLHGRELGFVMVDIDHFKQVNDTHGHSAGDEVIRRLADALSSEVRGSDSVCRYGGEEFCVVLPGASLEVAAAVADRMRVKIQSPGFTRVPITASFGVSSIREQAKDTAELIDQADKALYASKDAGRNCVSRWDELPPSSQS
jgi:diguanylate cyclase (GGDEF)-like protein/PAS domain S-box-containing protein